MAPTKMKLRVRRRESGAATGEREVEVGGAAGGGGGGGGVQGSSGKTPPSPPAPSGDEEASPDSKCPICLDRFNNLAYLDRCLHRFCFPCIQEWSHNKAECPLCKQAFTSILHSVRSHDDFKEYTLRPPPPSNGSLAATVAMVTAFAAAAAAGGEEEEEEEPPQRMRRRRRRRGELESGGGGARRRERGGVGGGRGAGSRARERRTEEQSGLLPPAPPLPWPEPSSPDSPPRAREEPGDRGVLFEGLAGLGAVGPGDRAARHLMSRLAARRRVQHGGGAPRRLREREMLAFRRALYRSGVRALLGDQGPPRQDVSAEGFARSPARLARLRPWLRRELTVLYGAHGSLVDIVQRIITSRVTRHGLERAPGLEDELRPFLLARTQHFLHELAGFARSALSMERYDAQAVYEPLGPAPSSSPANRLSSSAHSSVIAISEGEEPADRTGSLLSLATWDEDTPGPSYSTAEPAPPEPTPPPPAPEARRPAPPAGGGGEEECLIVGYVKPMAERTPELVQLSSDTEEEEEQQEEQQENPKEEEVLPPLPALFLSLSTPPSSSSTERHTRPAGPGPLPHAWSCSSGSPCPQERESRLLPHSSGGCEGGRRRKRRRRRRMSGERERCSLYSAIYSGLGYPRSRSSSSSRPRSPSSPGASPRESPTSRRPTPPSSSSPCPPQRHSDKPGGKRKYKSRHLDEDEDPTWRPGSGCRGDAHMERGGGGGGQKRGRRRERERRRDAHKHNSVCEDQSSSSSSSSSGGDGGHRSPSVEIIYEGKLGSSNPSGNKRRKKRRHHRKLQHSSSPVVITIDSQSSPDDGRHGDRLPVFSDLVVRQPIDFSVCDLPTLRLVEPGGVGGGLGANTGELPVNILARGSDWSDTEPNNQSKTSDVLAVDISDDDDDAADELGGERKEGGVSDGDGDESYLLATILDEIAQLNPGGRGQNSHTPLPWPGTKTKRRGRTLEKVETGSDLTALPPPPPADLPHTSEICPPNEKPAPDETRPLEWTRPLYDPGPFPETRPSDGKRPLKWNHPLRETCLLEWSRPVSPTRPFYKPRPLSDHRQPDWTHPPTLSCQLDRPRLLEWTLPFNETAHKQESAADQTGSLPVCSSNSPALTSSSEAPAPAVTSPAVNGVVNTSTAKLRPDRESSASPSLSPAPSQSVSSDRGPGQGCLKLQLPVGPPCVPGAAAHTHITDFHGE